MVTDGGGGREMMLRCSAFSVSVSLSSCHKANHAMSPMPCHAMSCHVMSCHATHATWQRKLESRGVQGCVRTLLRPATSSSSLGMSGLELRMASRKGTAPRGGARVVDGKCPKIQLRGLSYCISTYVLTHSPSLGTCRAIFTLYFSLLSVFFQAWNSSRPCWPARSPLPPPKTLMVMMGWTVMRPRNPTMMSLWSQTTRARGR